MLKHTVIVSERKKEILFCNITFECILSCSPFPQATLKLQVLEMKNSPKTSARMDFEPFDQDL